MKYILQLAVVLLVIVTERYITKWAKHKISDEAPYTSGIFVIHPLSGEKAVFMYKANIIITRVVLALLVASILVINTVR